MLLIAMTSKERSPSLSKPIQTQNSVLCKSPGLVSEQVSWICTQSVKNTKFCFKNKNKGSKRTLAAYPSPPQNPENKKIILIEFKPFDSLCWYFGLKRFNRDAFLHAKAAS